MTTFLSGYLSSIGVLNIYIAYIIIMLGDITSDILHYGLGYYGGNKLVEKYGHHLGFSPEKAEKMSKTIHANKIKTIFGKLIYGIGGVPIVACGLAKIPIWQLLIITIPLTIFQVGVYLGLGYYFGQFYNNILKYLDYGGYIFGGVAIIILGIYIYLNKKKTTISK